MKNTQPKYNNTLIIITVIAAIFCIAAFYFYWDITKVVIRKILEEKITSFSLWVITVLVFVVHYFKQKRKDIDNEPIITKKFGGFIDNILGGIAYGTAISTSITLLKGLFVQSFFKGADTKIYFAEFQDLDLMTIFGVTLFLLYNSIMKVIEIAKEAYKAEHTEKVLDENRNEVSD